MGSIELSSMLQQKIHDRPATKKKGDREEKSNGDNAKKKEDYNSSKKRNI